MTRGDEYGGVFWRGAPGETAGVASLQDDGYRANERVLVAVEVAGNRRRLVSHLSQRHQVVLPEGGDLPDEPFDLAVLDRGGLLRWHRRLLAIKRHAQPVFLPFMLILPRADVGRDMRASWHAIDDFIISPIDPGELSQRAEMLLRARRLAVAQRAQLAYLVNHDHLTGLPNRTLFTDRLQQAVREATVLGQKVHVVVVHVSLASVLKSLGTRGLEEAAIACSAQLQHHLGDEFALAQLSTEQWGLLLSGGHSVEDVLGLCRRVEELASVPLAVEGEHVHISPRIGVAVYPDDAPDGRSLLDRAMAALSHGDRRATPVFYSAGVQQQALHYLRTEAGLHAALENAQLELWMQPKIRLQDREVVGAEALVRWRLPGGELVSPANFIPVAETAGLITRVDQWVMEQTCAMLRTWRTEGNGIARVAVNISALHLTEPDFVWRIKDTLARYDVPASALELELTETALADLTPDNLARLSALREHGIRIALDDFGTGYCSLNYLHKLPITTLKIDRSFVNGLPGDETSVAIAQTVVALAKTFDLEIVAEGIETEAQAQYVTTLGVHLGQGYLFGRPLPARQLRGATTASPGRVTAQDLDV